MGTFDLGSCGFESRMPFDNVSLVANNWAALFKLDLVYYKSKDPNIERDLACGE